MGATMFGGSVFAEVSDQEFNEVRQGVNSNTEKITQLENAQSAAKDYSKDIAAHTTAIANEATERKAADSQLNTKMTKGFADIQGQQDEQNAQIGKNQKDIQTNAGKIQNNQDAIKANSDKIADHEDRISSNAKNIEANANTLHKVQGDVVDNHTAIQKEISDRQAADDTLKGDMKKNLGIIQGQQDEQNAQIGKNQKDIQTNAGKIQNNQDAIKANSDKIADHEDRISSNAKNIEANANTLHKVQGDVVDIQNTLKGANALASADATNAAKKAANDATKAADNANKVADGLKDRVDRISYNQDVTSESDLIKKDQSIGQNLTNVDKALHKEISDRQAADDTLKGDMKKNLGIIQGQQDEQNAQIGKNQKDIQTNAGKIQNNQDAIKANSDKIADHEDRISSNAKNIEANANTLHKVQGDVVDNHTAIQKEISDRQAADDTLKGDMKKNLGIIQGQQDEQNAQIGKNQKDIQTNAGKIQNNQDAIKANSGRLDNHEGRIAGNENNIATNAEAIKKETNARIDEDKKLQGNIDAEATARDAADKAEAKARADKDTAHDTAIAANKKAIGDEAAARQADVSRLDNKIHDVSKEVDTVGALSMAMSGLHPLSYDEGDARFQLSAAVGTYDGTEALALGGFYHFNRDSMLSVGVATDLGADEHRMGANVGYTRRIGQGGHVSRPSEGTVSDIMKDIKNLEQKQAKLEQENEQLKQQLAALKK